MLKVSELFIYPVKSLGGISVSSAMVTDRGFQYDRRWMLVDEHNQFLTQRVFPQMALLQVTLSANGLQVHHKISGDHVDIPGISATNETAIVQIWNDACTAQFVSAEADEWFSEMLSFKCRLVYMPDTTRRNVEEKYSIKNEITTFTDDFPFMMIGQSSLDDLNNRLEQPLPINRFRPNIVFTGGWPFDEDSMKHFSINNIQFYGVKLCARCVVTTINQDDSSKTSEPLKTLSTYRNRNNKIYFGQNLLSHGEGTVHVGDEISILYDQ